MRTKIRFADVAVTGVRVALEQDPSNLHNMSLRFVSEGITNHLNTKIATFNYSSVAMSSNTNPLL